MPLSIRSLPWKIFSYLVLAAAVFIVSNFVEQAGCAWYEAFDREIAPIYSKTEEGTRVPLRRFNIAHALPPDLAFIPVERLTPLFALVDKGHEIGRIRGYPGDNHFCGLLGALMRTLDNDMAGEHALLV